MPITITTLKSRRLSDTIGKNLTNYSLSGPSEIVYSIQYSSTTDRVAWNAVAGITSWNASGEGNVGSPLGNFFPSNGISYDMPNYNVEILYNSVKADAQGVAAGNNLDIGRIAFGSNVINSGQSILDVDMTAPKTFVSGEFQKSNLSQLFGISSNPSAKVGMTGGYYPPIAYALGIIPSTTASGNLILRIKYTSSASYGGTPWPVITGVAFDVGGIAYVTLDQECQINSINTGFEFWDGSTLWTVDGGPDTPTGATFTFSSLMDNGPNPGYAIDHGASYGDYFQSIAFGTTDRPTPFTLQIL